MWNQNVAPFRKIGAQGPFHISKMKMWIVRIFKLKMWTVRIFKTKMWIVRIFDMKMWTGPTQKIWQRRSREGAEGKEDGKGEGGDPSIPFWK